MHLILINLTSTCFWKVSAIIKCKTFGLLKVLFITKQKAKSKPSILKNRKQTKFLYWLVLTVIINKVNLATQDLINYKIYYRFYFSQKYKL